MASVHDITKKTVQCALFRTQEKETGKLESVEMFISPVLYQIENFTDNTEIRLDQKKYGDVKHPPRYKRVTFHSVNY